MERIAQKKVFQSLTYSETLAHAVVAVASTHSNFAQWLLGVLRDIPAYHETKHTAPYKPALQLPIDVNDESVAVRRAMWLLNTSFREGSFRNDAVKNTLFAWAKTREREDPKMVILGLKYGVLDFGIWGHPLKKETPIHIIYRSDTVSKVRHSDITTKAVALTHDLLAQGLRNAKGNVRNLDPELSDWFFGDKHVVLYLGSSDTIHSVMHDVKKFGIPTATTRDVRGIHSIALHPACTLSHLPQSNTLERIR